MTTPDLATIVDELEAEIGRLVAELAVVRRDWQLDVGTLTARAQTAEARAARLNTEVGYLLEENEEMGRREMQRAAAARKVAQFARKNMAAMQHVQRAQRERDAARAEAARLRSVAEELAGVVTRVRDGIRNDINGGDNVLTIYLNIMLDKFAALRGPAQSEQPAARRQEANDGN